MLGAYVCLEKSIDQLLSPLVLICYFTLSLSLHTEHFKSSNHTAACVTFQQNSCFSQYEQAYFYNKAVKPDCILNVGTKVTNLKFFLKEKKKYSNYIGNKMLKTYP